MLPDAYAIVYCVWAVPSMLQSITHGFADVLIRSSILYHTPVETVLLDACLSVPSFPSHSFWSLYLYAMVT